MTAGDEQALLQAMIADPEDDGPRLVYSDWLEEHGRLDRAEFIRIECELARMTLGSAEYDTRAGVLRQRQVELRGQHEKEWVAELNLPKNRHCYCWFKRGMIASVWCTIRYFLDHGQTIFQAAPVETICFRRATAQNIRALDHHPAYRLVRGVEFLLDETPVEVVIAFLENVQSEHLRALALQTRMVNSLWSGWHSRNVHLARTIANCRGTVGWKHLRLGHAGIGDEGGLALAQSPYLDELEILDLTNIALSESVQLALRQRFGSSVWFSREDYLGVTLGEIGW
jgi:uncharacterized protein (TIGR02996 family)